jgi:hypothetical protein
MSSRVVASWWPSVGRIHRRLAGAGWVRPIQAVDDVVGDAVALLLAEQQVAGQVGALGVLGEQVAQQQRRALDVAPGLLDEVEDAGVGRAEQAHS